MRIDAISSYQATQRLGNLAQKVDDKTTPFADALKQALAPVETSAGEAQQASIGLLTGETDQIHSVVIASEKAELALRLTMQVRNKALEAYQEIMRMQL